MKLVKIGLALGLLSALLPAWGQRTTIRLLTENYPPFNMPVSGGDVSGLSTEVVREIFNRAHIPYTIELLPWIQAINTAVLENNTCVYSTTRTNAREHQFKWIGPIVENPWVLFSGPKSPKVGYDIKSVRPYKLAGYNGDAVAQYLIHHGFNVELAVNDELNPRKLIAGRVDFWASGKYSGSYIIRQQGIGAHIKPVMVFNTAFMYLACNPGISNRMIFQLNSVLQSMQQDGFVSHVSKRYLLK